MKSFTSPVRSPFLRRYHAQEVVEETHRALAERFPSLSGLFLFDLLFRLPASLILPLFLEWSLVPVNSIMEEVLLRSSGRFLVGESLCELPLCNMTCTGPR